MSTSSQYDLPVRLGRYVLGPIVGVGGFAIVVRARDESLDADVAVKILTTQHALDPDIRERFVREARLLRRVRNPSVVTVHDVGETDDGRPYFVMDLAEGGVLEDRLAAAAVPIDDPSLQAVVTTLTDGLGALHAAGVVHRDVKPGNILVLRELSSIDPKTSPGQLVAPGERLVIGDLGIAKDQLATSRGPTMIGGTPRFQAPEQTQVGARVDARTDVYSATALLWVLITGHLPPSSDELPLRLLNVATVWRPVFAQGLAAWPRDRFESIAAWADAVRAAAGRAVQVSGKGSTTVSTAQAATIAATLPYKGLAAFEPEDAPLFFGRRELVEQLVARLGERAALVVGGSSGSGKSSAVRAGLLPALAGGALPGSQQWGSCILTPGKEPLVALAAELATLGSAGSAGGAPDAAALRDDPEVARAASSEPFVLVVDQLEELFTLCDDAVEQDAFLRAIAALSHGPRSKARVVLVVRADFYGACAARPWLASAINDNHVLVGPMTRAQLREAIEGPARRVSLQVDEGLVERVLADSGDDVGALPLIAHALVETWLRRDGPVLTVAGYEAAGGVAGSIAHTADHVWNHLDADEQRSARRLLLRLIHPGEGTPDTRRFLSWRDLGDDPATRLVLAQFADSRLLTVDDEGVQLAHEAVLRSWPRLAAWLDDSRDDLRAGERIEDAAREWQRQDEHPDLLYRGVPLVNALDWAARQDGDVGEPTASFLAAAQAARDTAEAAAATQERRAARLRRRVIVALVVLTASAAVASVFARRDAGTAQRATRVASQELAGSLATSSINLRANDPFLATVLAAESIATTPTPLAVARDALVESRVALAGSRLVPFGDPLPVGDALAVAMQLRGDLAATGNRDGTVAVWDVVKRTRVATLTGPKGGVQALQFTADGHWLIGAATDNTDHKVWRWRTDGRLPVAGSVLADPKSVVWAVAASPKDPTVAVTTGSGEVELLNADTGNALGEPLRPEGGELLSAAFSPDGGAVLAGAGSGVVYAWSVSSRQPVFAPIHAHASDIWEIVVRSQPASGSFVTVSDDGTAKIWNLADGTPLGGGPFDGGAADAVPVGARGATIGPDGDTLDIGGPDGSLYSWSVRGRRLVDKMGPAHRDRVTGAARSADGLTLATLGADHTMQVWSAKPRPAPIQPVAELADKPSSMAVAPSAGAGAGAVAVGAGDGTVRLLDPATGRERRRLEGHDGSVDALAFDGPGRLVTGDAKGTLRVWDVATGRVRATRRAAHAGAVTALAVRRGVLVSGGTDRSVRRWDSTTLAPHGDALATLGAPVTGVAIAERNGLTAASTNQGVVARWTAGGRRLADTRATKCKPDGTACDAVWSVAVDPDGATLAAASDDGVLTLWSEAGASHPRRTAEIAGHVKGAYGVVFDGLATVAVSAADGRLRLWDAATGAPIGPALVASKTAVRHVGTASDGSIFTAGDDGAIARFDGLSLRRACDAAAASFDDRQRARLLAGRPLQACR